MTKIFFLYFEETEYCFRAKNKGHLSYQLNKSKVKAKGRSVNVENEKNEESFKYSDLAFYLVKKFYFYPKKYGKFLSIVIFTPIIMRILFRYMFYKITNDKEVFGN